MKTAALHPCPYPRCGALTTGGRCPTHRLREADRPNADVRAWYRTPRWRALRAAVLRDQPFCPECAKLARRVATNDVDHVEPHRGDPGLFWSRSNLQGLCHAHHSEKTGRGA
jgi:5-methylcytosine-specific restriction enzyme A